MALNYVVRINSPGDREEWEARDWLRANADGAWSVGAWRYYPWWRAVTHNRTDSSDRTLGTVYFADETDATLFAIHYGGQLE